MTNLPPWAKLTVLRRREATFAKYAGDSRQIHVGRTAAQVKDGKVSTGLPMDESILPTTAIEGDFGTTTPATLRTAASIALVWVGTTGDADEAVRIELSVAQQERDFNVRLNVACRGTERP
jgi:hypothetical protein